MTDHKAHNNHVAPITKAPLQSDLLSIPDDSMIPGSAARSTRADYDTYFQLARTSPNLAQWSQSCISALRSERAGMREARLQVPDQLRILEGTIVVLEMLIENWIQVATAGSEQD
jgi:hypothetical protein